MKRLALLYTMIVLCAGCAASLAVGDQSTDAGLLSPPSLAPPASELGSAALQQLAAPIALYPDPLLGQVLTASTYPLEVVEAERWLGEGSNATLTGDGLTTALEGEPWDASVKGLVAFPATLRMMSSQLQWTEQLGEAFLARPQDVMDAIQQLRLRAQGTGALHSTPQQTVTTDQGAIDIEPTNPDVIYVPYYVPYRVFGPWPWSDYPPFYFGIEPGIYFDGDLIAFGIGIGIYGPWWGGFGWDWPHHRIYPHRSPFPMVPWRHDPDHRRGVPYRDPGNASRFAGGRAQGRPEFRGFTETPAPTAPRGPSGATESHRPTPEHPAAPTQPEARPQPSRATPRYPEAPRARTAPPAFESFGRGPIIRDQSERGAGSMRSMPSPPRSDRRPH